MNVYFISCPGKGDKTEDNTMAFDFNADDIFEIAGQIERNGAEFYKQAAQKVKDEKHRTMLLQLSEMEAAHEKTFADMRAGLSASDKQQTVFDPMNETALYLKAFADTRIFFKKQIDLSSMEEILKAAITAEKDSIVFYLGMRDIVPEKLGSKRVEDIISEEKGHFVLLSKELVALKG